MSAALPYWVSPLLMHLCQATVFGLLIAVLLTVFPSLPARWRHGLGWLGLAKFVLPLSLLGLALPMRTPQIWLPPLLVSPGVEAIPSVWPAAAFAWRLAMAVWLAGALLCLGVAAVRAGRFMRRLRAQRRPFEPARQRQLAALAATMGLDPARISGWTTPAEVPPGVSGIFRSRIHIPRELLLSLDPGECEAVLLHELAHVARRDNLWRLGQAFIVSVCWFHPLVWWLHRRLIQESERACDEAVVRHTRDGETYARGLLKAARFALGLGVTGFSGIAQSGLPARVAAIINPKPRKDHYMLRFTILLVAICGLAFTTGASTPPKEDASLVLPSDYAPRPIEQVKPVYPQELRAARINGKAGITIVVDKEGVVRNSENAYASHPAFGQAALAAVRQWKFLPGIKGGRPVNTRLTVPIVFSLP